MNVKRHDIHDSFGSSVLGDICQMRRLLNLWDMFDLVFRRIHRQMRIFRARAAWEMPLVQALRPILFHFTSHFPFCSEPSLLFYQSWRVLELEEYQSGGHNMEVTRVGFERIDSLKPLS